MKLLICFCGALLTFAGGVNASESLKEKTATVTNFAGEEFIIGGIWVNPNSHSRDIIEQMNYPVDSENTSLVRNDISWNVWLKSSATSGHTVWIPARIFAVDLEKESLHVTAVNMTEGDGISLLALTNTSPDTMVDINTLQVIGTVNALSTEVSPLTNIQLMGVPYGPRHKIVLMVLTGHPTAKIWPRPTETFSVSITVFHNIMSSTPTYPSGSSIVFTDTNDMFVSFASTTECRPFEADYSAETVASIHVYRCNGYYGEFPYGYNITSMSDGTEVFMRFYPCVPPTFDFVPGKYKIEAVWYPDGTYPFVEYP